MGDLFRTSPRQIRFLKASTYAPTDPGTDFTQDVAQGTPLDVGLSMTSMAGTGAGWQSAKVDLGELWWRDHALFGIVDFGGETPPVTGKTVDYYWAPSTSGTQANGNIFGNSGADAAAPNGATATVEVAEFIAQCIRIGSLVLSNDAIVQNGFVGHLSPPTEWGQLIVVNNGGQPFEAGDIEVAQFLNPNPGWS